MTQFSIIILAAGKGTRMNNPETPKVLAQANGKPLIAYVLDTALQLEPTHIYLIVGYKKELVIDCVTEKYRKCLDKIKFVHQQEQLGTGHAAKQVEPFVEQQTDVVILAGDAPVIKPETLQKFISEHTAAGADLSVLSATVSDPAGYGRIVRAVDGEFIRIREEKDASLQEKAINEINSGIYFLNTGLLFPALDKVKQNNAQKEYYLTDIIEIIKQQGKKVVAINCASFEEIQGVNTYEQLREVEKILSCD